MYDPFVQYIIDEVLDAVRGNLRRVAVTGVDDSGSQQLVNLTGLKGEAPQKVVRSQHFGLSSVPPDGGEGLLLEQGGRADRAHVLALEHKDYRPTGYKSGDTVLYDAHGNAISLVKQNINIVGAQTITLKASKIVLNGKCYLGSASASKPAAMQGTLDTAGNADISELATQVFVE